MNFVAAGLTDVGLQRDHNEDSFCILSEHRLFVVADGMGGHRAGDVASRMATDSIAGFFQASSDAMNGDGTWPFAYDPSLSPDENLLVTGIKLANQRIFEASLRHREVHGMGTTVVTALFARQQGQIYVAHVGDSRAYRVRGGGIDQLTRDHSLVNDYLLVMPNMTDSQRRELPTNVITRALGMQESVAVDLCKEDVQSGDLFVLCSDGLNGMLADEDIRLTIEHNADDVEGAVMDLVDKANSNGGEDNVTVIVVRIT